MRRRDFLRTAALTTVLTPAALTTVLTPVVSAAQIRAVRPSEDIPAYLERVHNGFDVTRYRQILGAANEFKEGDAAAGVAAFDEASRRSARVLLANTSLGYVVEHPVFEDAVFFYIQKGVALAIANKIATWTFKELKTFLLTESEEAIAATLPGLHSDMISCVVKLMSNAELIRASLKIFNPLPGSKIGAKGYLGARIQPNSPTDDTEDIRWQVFNGFAYGVGDVVLGTNPVSSNVESVAQIEVALADIIRTFELEDILPHCVLAHIDVQAQAEAFRPGSTALWFQSLGGVVDANRTFDVTVQKMVDHAAKRDGRYGLYFETGQGADGSNGHSKGFDIVMHEARKYGFARALKGEVAAAQSRSNNPVEPWVHVNDVAGFIGPEVFRSRRQLVRCCLEDTLMGKLHGLTIGLDICSTLHMDVDLNDLDWCLDQIAPANPAYLMALPTKNDPMLSYLTTGFQDHVRLRNKFGFKVNDGMWAFFQDLGVVDKQGAPGRSFGKADRIYLEYCRRKDDQRTDTEILGEARIQMERVRSRGVELTESHGAELWDLTPKLDRKLRDLYEDARRCIWLPLPIQFERGLGVCFSAQTLSRDRNDYILHPFSGEHLRSASIQSLIRLRDTAVDVQVVISDGLNALSLTDRGHLGPYLAELDSQLRVVGLRQASQIVVVRNGRVRAGYRIGEVLFGGLEHEDDTKVLIHIIGERPGSGHRAYSVYITRLPVRAWSETGIVDHNMTLVISGISDTSLDPRVAARQTVGSLGAQTKMPPK